MNPANTLSPNVNLDCYRQIRMSLLALSLYLLLPSLTLSQPFCYPFNIPDLLLSQDLHTCCSLCLERASSSIFMDQSYISSISLLSIIITLSWPPCFKSGPIHMHTLIRLGFFIICSTPFILRVVSLPQGLHGWLDRLASSSHSTSQVSDKAFGLHQSGKKKFPSTHRGHHCTKAPCILVSPPLEYKLYDFKHIVLAHYSHCLNQSSVAYNRCRGTLAK